MDHRQNDKTVDSLLWQSHHIQHRCLCGNAGCCLGGFLPLPDLSTSFAQWPAVLVQVQLDTCLFRAIPTPLTHHPSRHCSPLKNVFERLFHLTLMESCVIGATQNLNESFNRTIWQHCPKTESSALQP